MDDDQKRNQSRDQQQEQPRARRGHRTRIHFLGREVKNRSFLERVFVFLLGTVIFVLGFFFFAVALVIGLVLVSAFIARWWWAARKLRRKAESQDLAGEYVVVERDITPHGRRIEEADPRDDQERR